MNLLTQPETADETRLSERTLERHRLTGTGPKFVRLGRRVLYRREDVEEWIAANICRSTSEADAMAGRCGQTQAANSGDLDRQVQEISAGILRQPRKPDEPDPPPPWAEKAAPAESKPHQTRNKFDKKSNAPECPSITPKGRIGSATGGAA
jgi:predicted DNA-binding transcriptional regulator AlpA